MKYKIKCHLAKIRNEKKMSQRILFLNTGVRLQTIKAIECGQYVPSLELAFELANVLHVDINDLFKLVPIDSNIES